MQWQVTVAPALYSSFSLDDTPHTLKHSYLLRRIHSLALHIVLNQNKFQYTIYWFDCLEAGQLRCYLFGSSSIPPTCQLARNHPGLFANGWWIARGRIGGGVFCGCCLLLMLFDIPALLSALSSRCSSCSDILRGSLVWAAVSISHPSFLPSSLSTSLPLSLPSSLSQSLPPFIITRI